MPKKVIENYYPLDNITYAVTAIEFDETQPGVITVKVRNMEENKNESYLIKTEKHINAVLEVLSGKVSPFDKYHTLVRKEPEFDANLGTAMWVHTCPTGIALLLRDSPGYSKNENDRPLAITAKKVISDQVINEINTISKKWYETPVNKGTNVSTTSTSASTPYQSISANRDNTNKIAEKTTQPTPTIIPNLSFNRTSNEKLIELINGHTYRYLKEKINNITIFLNTNKSSLYINQQTRDGQTPLCAAAEEGQVEIAELLIKQGASLEVKNSNGDTPLIIAVKFNCIDFVEYLLKKGASINATNKRGLTASDYATFNTKNNSDPNFKKLFLLKATMILQILNEHTNVNKPQVVEEMSKPTDVKLTTDSRFFKNNSDSSKQVILNNKLCQAVKNLNVDNITCLLDQGANPNAIDTDLNKGQTILGGLFWGDPSFMLQFSQSDFFNKVKEVIKLLLNADADPTCVDGNKQTVYDIINQLTYINGSQKQEIVELFDKAVADKLAKNARSFRVN